jgi:hypothetical protein
MMQAIPPGDEAPKSDFREHLTPEQRRRIKRETAYHEAGHAIATFLTVGRSHIDGIDMRGDGRTLGFLAHSRVFRTSFYSVHPLPYLRLKVMEAGIRSMMGPFAERYVTGESWDWDTFIETIYYEADIDGSYWDGNFDFPPEWQPFTDADCLLNAVSVLPKRERWPYLRFIRKWTEEFGTHPLIKTAIERLGEMLVEVDFMEGERVSEVLAECLGNVSCLQKLAPAWQRRASVASRAMWGND